MDEDVDIAAVANALADPGRCRMLLALADGRALPASRLAAEAGVAPSTASVHLARLLEAGLLQVVPPPPHHGRHRFFRLAGSDVVDALEGLARIAPAAPIQSLRVGSRAWALRQARTCYDHLAGRLGVAVMDGLLACGVLVARDGSYLLADGGDEFFCSLGVDVGRLKSGRRPLIRYCIDWSEQRPHLGGALGAALASRLTEMGWVRRTQSSRAVQLTDLGRRGLHEQFGVDA